MRNEAGRFTRIHILFLLLAIVAIAAAKPQRLRVFSDTHIGSHWLDKPSFYTSFTNFLEGMADPDTDVTGVILNGDVFDLWLIPMAEAQYDLQTLVKMENKHGINVTHFAELLKNVAKNIPVYYVRGNHDMSILESDWKEVFGDLIPFYEDQLAIDGVQFMHGCQFDLFNAREYTIKPQQHPVGYYISRAAAEAERESSPPAWWISFLCEELLTKIAAEVIDAMRVKEVFELTLNTIYDGAFKTTEIHKKYDDTIYNGGSLVVSDNPTNITFKEAYDVYTELPRRWVDEIGLHAAGEMLAGACGAFDYFIERMPSDIEVLALGHSHGNKLEWHKKIDGSGEILYANSGAWVDDVVTYVDISYDYPGSPHPTWARIYSYEIDHGIEMKDEWMYAPDGDEVVRHTTKMGNFYSFDKGAEVEFPSLRKEETWDRINMYTLAMLAKAKVLSITSKRQKETDLEWYGNFYSLKDASLGDFTLDPSPQGGSGQRHNGGEELKMFKLSGVQLEDKAIYQLVQWWTKEGYTRLLN